MTTTYKLKTPVEHAGTTYTEATIRKPTVGDLMVMDKAAGDVGKAVYLLAAVTEIPLPAFQKIDFVDFQAISDMAEPFLGKSPLATAGQTSLQ